jgi:tRNA nucleotidyltransferase (CCA-adding enzyme)
MPDNSAPAGAVGVLDVLWKNGHEAFGGGGCVRDRLLGRAVHDWDMATSATPEEVADLFDRVVLTGLQHGTVTVVIDGDTYEVTTFRVEGEYADGRRPDSVAFTRSLDEDLSRRDFTINAMAWNPLDGRLIDLFDSQKDLGLGIVRAVGNPIERLGEDGLRSMRAIRFACVLDFELEAGLWAAIPATLETFRKVSVERIEVELSKTLDSGAPGRGVELLFESGLLGEIVPEIAGAGAEAVAAVAQQLARSGHGLEARYAVLLHDLSAQVGSAAEILRRLKMSNRFRKSVLHLLSFRACVPAHVQGDANVRRWVAEVGVAALDGLLAYRRAVSPEAEWDELAAYIDRIGARSGPHTVKDLSVGGSEVIAHLGISPSPLVGELLTALLEHVWENPGLNTAENLLALAAELLEGLTGEEKA